MLVSSSSLLVISTLFSTTTLAAPTRTHCRCSIVSDAPPAVYTPSSAHWTPSDPIPSPLVADICSNLGPELENFEHAHFDLYSSYLGHPSSASASNAKRPTSKSVLLQVPVRQGSQGNHDQENEPRPTARPHERIVCRSEPDPFSAYQSSFVNLWALQIIIAVAILACVAEGVHLGMRWMNRQIQETEESEKSALRLLGAEKRLLAIPASSIHVDAVSSPGAEKKLKAYESVRYFVTQSSSGRREFIAYEEEDDDEANRPVM
ncbi:hypothetical protein BKA66DRAFT_7528 [Pyrenochaeta sp. MPI-SDFR-AT-0127]|nr:hypothetical protein BKA66DRAFT_7528 [Pyrenochaeta sp. MPI-SDFR-AT-0127]